MCGRGEASAETSVDTGQRQEPFHSVSVKSRRFCPIGFLEISYQQIQRDADDVADQGHHETEGHRGGRGGHGTTGGRAPSTQLGAREKLRWQLSACRLVVGSVPITQITIVRIVRVSRVCSVECYAYLGLIDAACRWWRVQYREKQCVDENTDHDASTSLHVA